MNPLHSSPIIGRCIAGLALTLAGASSPAGVTDITWNADGTFEHRERIASGKFAEACTTLLKGQAVRWEFEADQALDFNIHFHEGASVQTPTRADQQRQQAGLLQVRADQEYCWMWANKSGAEAHLRFGLHRQ